MTSKELTPEEWRPLLVSENLSNSPGHIFRVLENKIHERYYQLTPRTDISPRQVAVLLKLYQVGQATQTELAALIQLDRSTLSEMSNRMCDRGLLSRSVHEHDRRASTLQLTEAGEEALLACIPSTLRAQRELMEPLADEYRPLFFRALNMLYQHHTQSGGVGAPASSDSVPSLTPGEPKSRKRAPAGSAPAKAKRSRG